MVRFDLAADIRREMTAYTGHSPDSHDPVLRLADAVRIAATRVRAAHADHDTDIEALRALRFERNRLQGRIDTALESMGDTEDELRIRRILIGAED